MKIKCPLCKNLCKEFIREYRGDIEIFCNECLVNPGRTKFACFYVNDRNALKLETFIIHLEVNSILYFLELRSYISNLFIDDDSILSSKNNGKRIFSSEINLLPNEDQEPRYLAGIFNKFN
jgi:hypothetical protein